MSEEAEKRAPYADWQNNRLVAAYFELDRIQRAGGKVVKTDLYRSLAESIGGNPGGVESKFQNISAVLASLELEYVEGLKPRPNIQQSLANAVERYLDANFHSAFPEPVPVEPDPHTVLEVSPPSIAPARPRIEATVERIARKYNWAERDARNRRLGTLGENLVLRRERLMLSAAGKEKLAEKVRHVSEVDGDGLGYDILSYDPTGQIRLIEVKTTSGPATTDFFLTRLEREVSVERSDVWQLHRVHLFYKNPSIFVIKPPLDQAVNLRPETWRGMFTL